MQVSKEWHCRVGGDVKHEACFDLFIEYMPDGLLVPNILIPQTSMLGWNVLRANWAKLIFELT